MAKTSAVRNGGSHETPLTWNRRWPRPAAPGPMRILPRAADPLRCGASKPPAPPLPKPTYYLSEVPGPLSPLKPKPESPQHLRKSRHNHRLRGSPAPEPRAPGKCSAHRTLYACPRAPPGSRKLLFPATSQRGMLPRGFGRASSSPAAGRAGRRENCFLSKRRHRPEDPPL